MEHGVIAQRIEPRSWGCRCPCSGLSATAAAASTTGCGCGLEEVDGLIIINLCGWCVTSGGRRRGGLRCSGSKAVSLLTLDILWDALV